MRIFTIAAALFFACGPAAAQVIVPVTSAIGVPVTVTINNSLGDQSNPQASGLRVGSGAFAEKARRSQPPLERQEKI